MATAASTVDRVYLFRLQILVIDGGTRVLRNIFNQKLPNQLQTFLANERATINRLKAKHTITQSQCDKLYPQGGQPPNIADFDITLIICLLRSIRSLGLNTKYTWNIPPQPTDKTFEADLHRLKEFRNEVAHVPSTYVIQLASFQAKWTEIEQVLQRLNSTAVNPLPNLQQTLDSYKNDYLDPAEKTRIEANVREWEEMESKLEQEKQQVKKLKEHVDRSAQEVQQVKTELKQHVDRSAQEVQQVKTELTQHVDRSAQEVRQVKIELTQHIDRSAQEVQQVETELKQRVDRSDQKVDELTLKFVEVDRRVKVVENTKSKQTAVEEKIAFEELKQNLRNDLKATYRRQYATIQLSPMIEEEDISLLKFYVKSDIHSVNVKRNIGGGKEEKTKVPFFNIFYKYEENKKHRNSYKEIYLMADAGLGKTSFSKRLALTWCQSKDPLDEDKDHFSDEEIEILSGFDFVFLVLLRDSSSECSVDDMIFNQLFPRFGHTGYNKTDLENVLNKERCLVLLDGLDEWEHPQNNCTRVDKFIPHRAARETTTVLTTTRPWKLSVGGINASQIEQKLEIAGLNKTSRNKLKESFISHVSGVKDKDILKKKVDNFNSDMEDKRVSELAVTPILLMFMLCLWCDNKNLGNTLSELYSNIVELMLTRTVVKYMNKDLPHIPAYIQGDIPNCFSELENCVKFYSLLMSLGELAFHTLFRETKEANILVFDVSVANRYLSKESLDFCLKTGLLTQTKDGTKLCKQTRKISFSHKSIQEYFAALYMCSSIDQSSVLETLKSKCKCIKDILEISKSLLFISGINADMLSLISQELVRIVNNDEITCKYRSSVERVYYHPLKEYQDLWVSYCKEMSQESQAILCIEDVFIDDSCEQEQYRKNLRLLTTRNQQNIKSVYIDMDETPYKSTRELIDYFSLTRLDNLEKVWYLGDYDSDFAILLKTSVKCLYLSSSSLDCPRLPCKEVTSLNKLEVIYIRVCSLSHSELTEFYNYISRTKCLREIKLEILRCTDHGWPPCPESRLELLQHSQLRTLSLCGIPVTEIEINLAILEKCKLKFLYYPVPVFKFRNHPAADSNLPGNTHVMLYRVTMAASSLRQLVDLIQELPQSVLVEIERCTIEPEDEFRRQIHRINTSSQFRMLEKLEEDSDGSKTFQFKTITGEH